VAESKLLDSWPVRVASLATASVAAALIGAHTDLIRALPTISPRVGELSEQMRLIRERVDACEVWQAKHEEYARENSRELHEGLARNSGEIEKLRERIDRALERGK